MAGVVVAVRLPSLFEPQWYSDDGFFTAVAWASSQGRVLYAGVFDNQPPLIYWLYRLLIVLGGRTDHFLVQLVALIAVTASALLVLQIAGRLVGSWPAALAALLTGLALSLPTLDGDLVNVEIVALPLFLAGLAVAYSARSWTPFAAGALLGLAVATRPSYALDGLALLLPISAGHRLGRFLLAALGGGAAAVAVVTGLSVGGSLNSYLSVVLPADHNYLVWANGGSTLPVLVRLALLAVIAGVGLLRAGTPASRLLAIWIPASLAGASLTPRGFTHYAHEAIPPLAFGLAILMARLRPRLVAAPAAALALVVAVELLLILPAQQTAAMTGSRAPAPFLHNFGYAELPAYYSSWALYALGLRTRREYESFFPGFARDTAEVEFVDSHARAGDRLLVLGDRPWVYVRSGLLPAGRFLATNSAFDRVPVASAELRGTLERGCAAVVIYDSGPSDWHEALRVGGYRQITGTPAPGYISNGGAADGSCP